MSSVVLPVLNLQDQTGILFMEFIFNLSYNLSWYWIVEKEIPPFIEEPQMTRYKQMRGLLFKLLFIQLACQVFVGFVLLNKPIPCHYHSKMTIGLPNRLFVLFFFLLWISRMVILFASFSFLLLTRPKSTALYQKRQVLLSVLVLFTFIPCILSLLYYILPLMNKGLLIHDTFYQIRNLFINKDPDRQDKIRALLRELKSVVGDETSPVFESQWKCSLRNKILS